MARQTINIGTSANKGDGDPLRLAFTKANSNFNELYAGNFVSPTSLESSLISAQNGVHDLGSGTNQWNNLHVKDFIYLGGKKLSMSAGGALMVNNGIVQVTDVVGSVFADDSKMMMDALTGTLFGPMIGDVTGSLFADDSTVMVDAVGKLFIGNLVGDVTGSLTGPVVGDITSQGPSIFSGTVELGGATVNNAAFNLTGDVTGTVSSISNHSTTNLTEGTNLYYTDARVQTVIDTNTAGFATSTYVDGQIANVSADHFNFNITGDDSTVRAVGSGSTISIAGGTAITTASDADGNITITGVAQDFAFSSITGTPTTISGYGITDAYTKTEVDAQISASTGDLTGSVFGDDSTLLVDGINNKIVGAVETSSLRTSETSITLGNNAQSEGSYSLSIGTGARSDTYGVAIGMQTQAATYDINVGAFSGKNHYTSSGAYRVAVGAFAQQNANPGDETGTGAIAIGTLAGDANQGANAVAIGRYAGRNNQAAKSIVINATDSDLENTTADSLVIKPIRNAVGTTMLMYDATSGEVTYSGSIQESFSTTNGATGVTALDCSTGNVHYLTAPTGDITANFTNLNVTAEYATNVTVVIDQGGTEYEITAVQIGGVAQTIVWQGNSAPTGTANGVDSFSFTILNDGGTYVVLGQMVAFGGV